MMKESVIDQEIIAEGRAGGRQEEGASLVLRLLRKRIGQISLYPCIPKLRKPHPRLRSRGLGRFRRSLAEL